jgi:hypothetical protein
MILNSFKESKQRIILERIGQRLIEMSHDGDAEDVEVTLNHIQEGYLDVLGQEDFFGTEGWEHWLDLD